MITGMDRDTGKALSGRDHLEQSVTDILTTPIGTRVMNRDYGSNLFELVDTPVNKITIVDFYAATVGALLQWEPRIRVTKVACISPVPGVVQISVNGVDQISGADVTIEGIEI